MSGLAAVAAGSPAPGPGGSSALVAVALLRATFTGTADNPTGFTVTDLLLSEVYHPQQDAYTLTGLLPFVELSGNTVSLVGVNSDSAASGGVFPWVVPDGTTVAELNASQGLKLMLVQIVEAKASATRFKSVLRRIARMRVRFR